MRIVYLVQYFRFPNQGGSSRPYEMARRLAAAGHDVHIVASETDVDDKESKWMVERVAGFSVHLYPVPYSNSMGLRTRMKAFIRFARVSGRYARGLKPHVVFASSTPLTIAIPAIFAVLFRKTSMVFEVRDLWPEVPIALGGLSSPIAVKMAYILQWLAYRRATHIVALSPQMKDGIVARGVDKDKVSMIPNAADLDLFQGKDAEGARWRLERGIPHGHKVVLYCGTLGRVNDTHYIAKLAKEVLERNANISFYIIGDGSEKAAVRSKAKSLGVLGMNFFMLDGIPKLAVPSVFAASDLTMSTVAQIPELFGNSANKFFDSLAAGKPIAINHTGWQAELLESSGAGLVLDGTNFSLAADQLLGFLADSDRMAHACAIALQLARERFSRDMLAEQLNEVLERAGS